MFQPVKRKSKLHSAVSILELIYHSTVRNIRLAHGNAVLALVMNVLTTVIMVAAFYFMFTLLGLGRIKVRGDFILYLMSGVFLYLTHAKALGAVVGSGGPTSPMMLHAPMNTIIMISSGAISSLYTQVLSMFAILFIYDVAVTPITIEQPIFAFAMLLVAWFTGIAAGLVLVAIKPWYPTFVNIFSIIYRRANMIASGKMFVANSLPPFMLHLFNWNPLFHAIDQCRGFTFINYTPHNSSLMYPIYVGIALTVIGMLGEFYTRQYASVSWGARL